jgi:hypothetical protein
MATPDQIPTDLTLEIDANVTPEQFMAAARAFFGYVDEVARSLAPDGAAPKWKVMVREGSNLLAVEPAPSALPAVVQAVYARADEGARQLAEGNLQASRLSEPALKHLKTLSELTEAKGNPVPLRLWVKRQPLQVNQEIGRVIREDWRADYKDYGTVEGRLTAIQEHGTLQLLLKDEWLKQTIRCYVPEEQLPDAFANFRRRVEVSGVIHYRRNGTPISVEVEAIDPLPDDSELPSSNDVRGLLKAAG